MSQEIGIISIYSPKATLHGSGASGVGSYTKNLLTSMAEHIRKKIVVLSEISENSSNEAYVEDFMLIDRCWERKGLFSWSKQILTSLKKYPHLKIIHIQHEFNMFGSLFTIPVFLFFLWKLRNYNIIITYHGVVDTNIIDNKYGEINSLPKYFPPFFLKFAFFFFYWLSSKLVSKVIVHEDYFKEVLCRYGFNFSQVEVKYHGIEDKVLSISKPIARKNLGINIDKKVLLYFGFLAGYKGVDLLLDAFEQLDLDKYHLILAGGAPKRTLADSNFCAWYDKVDLRAKKMEGVTRMGFVPDEDIDTLYAAADILIIPYLYMLAASGPMALAITYELPFLVSEVFSPVIVDKKMRFEKTPESLIKRIVSFDNDFELIHQNILSMREQRLWSKIAKQTELLYF